LRRWCDAAHDGTRTRIPLAWFVEVQCEGAPHQVAVK
jgi:hypothetical protein